MIEISFVLIWSFAKFDNMLKCWWSCQHCITEKRWTQLNTMCRVHAARSVTFSCSVTLLQEASSLQTSINNFSRATSCLSGFSFHLLSTHPHFLLQLLWTSTKEDPLSGWLTSDSETSPGEMGPSVVRFDLKGSSTWPTPILNPH